VSRELFESILASEEEHIDWLETQLELIDRLGTPNYLQSSIAELKGPEAS
jgi:bacterioferritin